MKWLQSRDAVSDDAREMNWKVDGSNKEDDREDETKIFLN